VAYYADSAWRRAEVEAHVLLTKNVGHDEIFYDLSANIPAVKTKLEETVTAWFEKAIGE